MGSLSKKESEVAATLGGEPAWNGRLCSRGAGGTCGRRLAGTPVIRVRGRVGGMEGSVKPEKGNGKPGGLTRFKTAERGRQAPDPTTGTPAQLA